MIAVAAAAFFGARAAAAPGLFVGFSGDEPKGFGSAAIDPARTLGAAAYRITLSWAPGQTDLSAADVESLDRVVAAANGMRIVVAAYGRALDAPQDDQSRDDYCNYVRSVIARYPAIRDVVIWNEPNLSKFWQPQFDSDGTSAAPAAYEALLAHCWDVLHAYDGSVNVVAPATSPHGNDNPDAVSNISHSPGNFIRKIGNAYRASGRALPLFDTVGQHVYGATPAERPWRMHTSSGDISEGDWNKLVDALSDAFSGTGQPLPGNCSGARCVAIWYLETGFQTTIDDAKQSLYASAEDVPGVVPDDAGGEPDTPTPSADTPAPDQATQIRYALRLAYCQPYVGGFFNFMLWDDFWLPAWQSGPFWADRTPKDSYPAFAETIAAVNANAIVCSPPTPPNLVAAYSPAPKGIALSWGRASSNVGVSGYRVYRDGDLLATTTSAFEYLDLGLDGKTRYSYTVRAFDAAGRVGVDSNVVRFGTHNLLSVARGGNRKGAITSEPATAINCGYSCSFWAAPGSVIVLTAAPFAGSLFTGWTGACKGTDVCMVTMDDDKSVTAVFAAAPKPATTPTSAPTVRRVVVKTEGRGRVTSSPRGIDCGKTCAADFAEGTGLTLTAVPGRGQQFVRWGGACTGARSAPACVLAAAAGVSATATFAASCVVPQLIGKRLTGAKRALRKAHCRLGKLSFVSSARDRGTVVSQRPAAAAKRPNGAKVGLVVSRGGRSSARHG